MKHTPEARERMSAAHKDYWARDENRIQARAHWVENGVARKAASERAKAMWDDPERRAKQVEAIRAGRRRSL